MNTIQPTSAHHCHGAFPRSRKRPRLPRVLALAGLAAGLGLLSAQTSHGAAQPTVDGTLRCIEEASHRTGLLASQRDRLCLAAPTPTGPLECFIEAQGMFLTDEQSITLCRCSPDDAPIECYREVRRDAALTQEEIVSRCSPSRSRLLGATCR